MDISTKYGLQDEIWCISDHKIKCLTIIDFTIKPSEIMKSVSLDWGPDFDIEYETTCGEIINERDCFATKQELINSLIK